MGGNGATGPEAAAWGGRAHIATTGPGGGARGKGAEQANNIPLQAIQGPIWPRPAAEKGRKAKLEGMKLGRRPGILSYRISRPRARAGAEARKPEQGCESCTRDRAGGREPAELELRSGGAAGAEPTGALPLLPSCVQDRKGCPASPRPGQLMPSALRPGLAAPALALPSCPALASWARPGAGVPPCFPWGAESCQRLLENPNATKYNISSLE